MVAAQAEKAHKLNVGLGETTRISRPQPNDFSYAMVDLHINRDQRTMLYDDCQGPKFYEKVFPIRFELHLPKDHPDKGSIKDLTVYISSHSNEPSPGNFQKMVEGKRGFTFDAEDYFRRDLNISQYTGGHAKAETKLMIENQMRATKIYDRPYLYLAIYYKYKQFTTPLSSLLVNCYLNGQYGERMRYLLEHLHIEFSK